MINETNAVAGQEPDLMDMDVNDIDTSFPRLAKNLYEFECDSAEVVSNNAGTGQNLRVVSKTTSPATSSTGDPLPAGYKLTSNIGLTPTEKYTKKRIGELVADFMKSHGITGTPRAFLDNASVANGKIGHAKVGIQPEGDYPESNKIVAWVIKK